MSNTVIKIENLSKLYRLGVWGTGTLRDDLAKSWARFRGKSDPTASIGQANELATQQINKSANQQIDDYVWALKDINLEVKQGEVLGIIGKNGAGKSTLLKILSQITSPTRGSIKMKGRVASLLEVGTGMHQELTGRENIFLNGAILGMRKTDIQKKFDEIVDFSGIAKYVDTPIKRFSSGMRVRLGFAIAAFLEPELLIVDEVLAVGDAEFQRKAIGKMKDVSKSSGRTVLFVSHNMASIKNLCTKAVLLETGSITCEGNVEKIISEYLIDNSNDDHPYLIPKNYEIYNDNIKIKRIKQLDNGFTFIIESNNHYENLALVVHLFTKDGTLIFKSSTNPIWSSKSFTIDGTKEITLEFEKLNLIQDIYYLGVQITIPKEKVLVSIENAFQFEYLNDVNYGGNKTLIPGRDGILKLKHNWNF